MLGAQKNPSQRAGVVSLFAVTHQGPAQGGKAGGSKLPGANLPKYFADGKKISRKSRGTTPICNGVAPQVVEPALGRVRLQDLMAI
jgi:hypothetical protein